MSRSRLLVAQKSIIALAFMFVGASEAWAQPLSAGADTSQLGANKKFIAYFLPFDTSRQHADIEPDQSRLVAIARVKVLHVPAWVGRRHTSDATGPEPQPTLRFTVRLHILDLIVGSMSEKERILVGFGDRRIRSDITFPFTPEQLNRTYTTAIYRDSDGHFRLGGFEISASEYNAWRIERDDYRRSGHFRPNP